MTQSKNSTIARHRRLTSTDAGELYAIRRSVEFGEKGSGDMRPVMLVSYGHETFSTPITPKEFNNVFEFWDDLTEAEEALAKEQADTFGIRVEHDLVRLKDLTFDAWIYDHYDSRNTEFFAIDRPIAEAYAAGMMCLGVTATVRVYLVAGFAMHGTHTQSEAAEVALSKLGAIQKTSTLQHELPILLDISNSMS